MGDDGLGPEIKDLTLYYLISEIIFLLGKYPVLHIFTKESHMRFCSAKPIPEIGVVQHNLCRE